MGPGLIYSSGPGFIYFVRNGTAYELHSGARVLGKSTVLHELDVCILTNEEAVRCRQSRSNPRGVKIKLVVECKYYGQTLPLRLGREYIGLGNEFGCRVKTLASNDRSDEVQRLLSCHKGTSNFEVIPGTENRFISWLETELMQVLI